MKAVWMPGFISKITGCRISSWPMSTWTDLTGTQLLDKVKDLNQETIVILYSDLSEKEEMVREAGADAFLAKPFGVSELFNLVQRFVVDGRSNN